MPKKNSNDNDSKKRGRPRRFPDEKTKASWFKKFQTLLKRITNFQDDFKDNTDLLLFLNSFDKTYMQCIISNGMTIDASVKVHPKYGNYQLGDVMFDTMMYYKESTDATSTSNTNTSLEECEGEEHTQDQSSDNESSSSSSSPPPSQSPSPSTTDSQEERVETPPNNQETQSDTDEEESIEDNI